MGLGFVARKPVAGSRFVAALAAAVGFCGICASAQAETLNQALASAYEYNPQLDAERARLRATDEEVTRARSGFRPVIQGSADINYQYNRQRGTFGTNESEVKPKGYSIDAVQPIFSGFRVINAVNEQEANVRAARETLRAVEQDVLLQAVTAFMDVVRDQAIVRLRENNVTVLTRDLRATQDRFNVGEVTRTDVAQAEARRAGSVSALDLARANLRTSRAAFERVVGNPPSNLTEPGVPNKVLPRSVEEASGISAKESPNVIASLYREQAARHTVDRIWGELLPSVQLEAGYNRRYDTSRAVDESESTSVTGRLNVPIYQGGEVHARVRQSKHTHVSRLQEIEQQRSEVQAAVVSAWSSYQAAIAQLASDQAQVNANRTALTGVREEEKVGQRTILDVLNAEQELLNSEVNLVTTKRNLVVASYNVLAQVGRLDVKVLGVSGTVYDPEAHYHEVRRRWFGISITHRDGRREQLDVWPTQTHQPAK